MPYDPKIKRNWTKAQLDAFAPRDERYDILSDRRPGLKLRVYPSGSKTWLVDYRYDGRRRSYTIGPYPQFSHSQAARHAEKAFAESPDPMGAKQAKRKQELEATLSKGTLEDFLEGDYWTGHLSLAADGKATKARIRNVFAPFLAKPLKTITATQLEDHLKKRLRKVKLDTVYRDRAAIQGLLSYAVKRKRIESNPAAAVDLPKRDNSGVVRYLSDAERDRLLAAAEDPKTAERIHDLLVLALNTGMRRGEMFNLDWSDVDLDRGIITVRGDTAKSGQTRRVPINATLLAMLERRRDQYGRRGIVIPGDNGKPLVDIKKAWKGLIGRAKVRNFRLHDCRHDFASRMVQAGVPLNTVRELLGHSSMAMVMRYAHLAPENLDAAVAVLDGK